MDKAFAESHACDVDTEEEPNGTCVWYMQRHFGYGEELRKTIKKRSSEDAKMIKYNISMPDNAEGQRLNPVTGFE